MSPDGEIEEVVPQKPKRAPRKRVPKAVSDEAGTPAPVKRAPRKRAPKKVVETVEEKPKPAKTVRKAPTPIADDNETKKKKRKQIIVVTTMIVIGIAASAAVGFTDKGTIDVQGTIAWRNEQSRSTGNEGAIVPEQNSPQLPDGGLVGLGIGGPIEEEKPTPEEAAASSTPATASSTESVGQVPLTAAEAEAAASQQQPPTEAEPQ
jgi:hypothetical protein